MLRLAKAFWDIALWRRSPAHLPASLFLLGMVSAAVALLEVLGAMLPPGPSDRILTRVILSVGLPLVFARLVLAVGPKRAAMLRDIGIRTVFDFVQASDDLAEQPAIAQILLTEGGPSPAAMGELGNLLRQDLQFSRLLQLRDAVKAALFEHDGRVQISDEVAR